MRITKNAVIQTASQIANENGLHNVSLKAVAEQLNIRTPSLYNHIQSLDDLLRNVAHCGMNDMNERMTKAVIGFSGVESLKVISLEYLNYTIENPGIYETIQWAAWHATEETTSIYNNYINLLTALIHSCHFSVESTKEILDLFTGLLHGFITLNLKYAFNHPDTVRAALNNAIDTLFLGIHQKYA